MRNYILQRIGFFIPTLLIIFTVNFFIIQLCPGGPVEQMIAKISGNDASLMDTLTGAASDKDTDMTSADARMQKPDIIDPELRKKIVAFYGFDRPITERYLSTLKNYLVFDFGRSFSRDARVVDLIVEKLPVSITLGIWTTLLANLIAIPLGIRKAVKAGSVFDRSTSLIIAVINAIPTFLIAILLIIFLAGGRFWTIFPLRGLLSVDTETASWFSICVDYLHHISLPVFSLTIGSLAGLVMLTRNSFLEEIGKQYVVALRAKGFSKKHILYRHIFRNAMLVYISSFPELLIGMFFTGSLLIEIIFSLDGLGLLGFEAVLNKDYPVMLATLYISTLLGLVTKLLSDISYVLIDPRIDFRDQK